MINIYNTAGISFKLTALILFVSLSAASLGNIHYTEAYYTDSEETGGNLFVAGEVDFTATSTEWNPLEVAVNMAPGDITIKDITIDPQNSNPFQYYTDISTSGDTNFCDGIIASLNQDGDALYEGSLPNLLTGTTTSLSTLTLSATTDGGSYENSVCDFSLDFKGWQTRHNYPTIGGYNDTETVEASLASWGFRINKVYYDVAPDRGVEGDNEWVEIYNQTNVPLDLVDWEICDNSECNTIATTSTIVAPMGYAVITDDPHTFSATGTAPWYLPPGVVYVPLNELIGNGLANDGDMLLLKRPDGVIVDQMNWGPSDDAWTNFNDGVWTPEGAVDVDEGNLLARVPSGYDTDQPSDWVELVPPVVDMIYPDEGGSYTWYWGFSYNITWTATNPNGPDEDLNISLFYIKDVDQSGDITPADITYTITDTTENDGAYSWTVPSGFIGYIWIKLVATGPENPLNNSRTVSGMIYDPVPLLIGPEGIESDNLADFDIEAPTITLIGENPLAVPLGTDYADPGIEVSDNQDPNVPIAVDTSAVDTAVLGTYSVVYHAIDQMGNLAELTRTVVVYDPALGVPELEPLPLTNELPEPVVEEDDTATSTETDVVASSTPKEMNEDELNELENGGGSVSTPTISTGTTTSASDTEEEDIVTTPEETPATKMEETDVEIIDSDGGSGGGSASDEETDTDSATISAETSSEAIVEESDSTASDDSEAIDLEPEEDITADEENNIEEVVVEETTEEVVEVETVPEPDIVEEPAADSDTETTS